MDAETSQRVITSLLDQIDLAKEASGSTTMQASTDVLQKANDKLCIGIIGGSGVDDPDILQNRKETDMDTPYGKPSGPIVTGQIGGVDCVLVARHGPKHRIMPTNVPFRANIYALKVSPCPIRLHACCYLPLPHIPACSILPLFAASRACFRRLDARTWSFARHAAPSRRR